MRDHNLDDLIIDEVDETTTDKTKGILTIVALVVVVLVIAIVITKLVIKTPQVDSVIVDDKKEIIDPALKKIQKEETKDKEPKRKDDTNIEDIEDDYTIGEHTIETIDESKEKKRVDVTPPKPKEEPKPHDKPIKHKVIHKIEKPKVVTPKAPKHTEHKRVVDKVVITDEFEQIKKSNPIPSKYQETISTKHKEPKSSRADRYYIQVGSFSKVPSSRFLSIIKNSGFEYMITQANSRGIKKLLIGPYSSREAVDRVLPKVRDRINKGAFVYKAK
jgi:DedD protein